MSFASLIAACGTAHELPVPDVAQTSDYTCSASALQAILAYYGEETTESGLTQELGATPADGAPPDAIVRVAQAHHLHAELREGLTIDEIGRAVARGIPVLVSLQAWANPPRARFADDWDDGHYAIVVAIEGNQIVFEDPSLLGSRGVLSRSEFEDRWHDIDGDRRSYHLGIFFSGPHPAPPPRRRHID